MAGQHSKRNRRSRNAKARRRRGVVGLGTGAGAMLAFGMGPLAAAPSVIALDPASGQIRAAGDPRAGRHSLAY